MRILMLSHGYPPTISGVTLVVQKIARALVQRGHEVTVLTGSERGAPYSDQDEGVNLIRVRSRVNPFWSEGPIPTLGLQELKQVVDQFKPDIIHTHENVILSTQLLRLNLDVSIPKISSCYFLPRYITHYLRSGSVVERGIQGLIWRYIIGNLNRFDHVIFSTSTQQQDYIEHGLQTPSTVISNGVDTQRYHPLNSRIREVEERYHLPPNPRILFVGRLAKDKKIEVLIQAMAQVWAEREAHLLIVGRGDYRPYLEQTIERMDLQRCVHLLGFVPEADLPAIYRASDIFAIASICEVQSIPALQAAVTGLPIIAANAAALPELVHENVNGFLVPPDDPRAIGEAILELSNDPKEALRFGRGSLIIGRQHAEVETFQAYECFYRRMADATLSMRS